MTDPIVPMMFVSFVSGMLATGLLIDRIVRRHSGGYRANRAVNPATVRCPPGGTALSKPPAELSGAVRAALVQGWLDPNGKVNRAKLAAECEKLAKEDPQIAEFMDRCPDCGGSGVVPNGGGGTGALGAFTEGPTASMVADALNEATPDGVTFTTREHAEPLRPPLDDEHTNATLILATHEQGTAGIDALTDKARELGCFVVEDPLPTEPVEAE